MTDPRALLLAAGCLVCGSMIGIELLADRGGEPAVVAAPPRQESSRLAPSPTAARADTLLGTITARPLFSPNRRPADAAQSTGTDELSDKRLAGIVIEHDRKLAIFAVSGGKPLTVSEGDDVNGWRVESITPHEISLRGPGGVRTLQPKLDTTARNDARPATPPPPPGPPRAPARAFPGPPATAAPMAAAPTAAAAAAVPNRRGRE